MSLLKIVSVVALVSAAPAVALASCAAANLQPTLILNASKTVPVNVGGIPFFGTNGRFFIALVEAGDTTAPVDATVAESLNADIKVLKPDGWAEGNTYEVLLQDGDTIISETVMVIGAFELTGTPKLSVSYNDGNTYGTETVEAEVVMSGVAELADQDLSPYLIFETTIDGETRRESSVCSIGPNPGVTAFGQGVDYLVAPCGNSSNSNIWVEDLMTAGTYSVGMKVSIIGDNSVDTTAPISVDLCVSETENHGGGTTTGGTGSDPTGEFSDDDGGCSSTAGSFGVFAFLGLIGLIRRRG
jgi:hypothetical protein